MRWLREAIDEFTPHMRKGFFFFVTGLHGVPLGGDFRILVDKKPNIAWLPSTSTCYNTLHLPPYESKRTPQSQAQDRDPQFDERRDGQAVIRKQVVARQHGPVHERPQYYDLSGVGL